MAGKSRAGGNDDIFKLIVVFFFLGKVSFFGDNLLPLNKWFQSVKVATVGFGTMNGDYAVGRSSHVSGGRWKHI
jgi:hypothetical protein